MNLTSGAISARPTQGYFMVPAVGGQHTLGGYQSIAGAISPNSGRPLLQLALVSTSEQRLELQSSIIEELPLLFSWTCDIHRGEFSYRVGPRGIEILNFEAGTVYTKFPYENYPDGFPPTTMDLIPIDPGDQQIILELNDPETRLESQHREGSLDKPRHQLGGIPRLMQEEVVNRKCPRCKGEMPLFASIADDNGTRHGFVLNEYVQVLYHLCRPCWVINCYNMSD